MDVSRSEAQRAETNVIARNVDNASTATDDDDLRDDAMYGRSTERPIVDKHGDDWECNDVVARVDDFRRSMRGRRLPIRTISHPADRGCVKTQLASLESCRL
jgi:flagellar basal body rod protein FlgC